MALGVTAGFPVQSTGGSPRITAAFTVTAGQVVLAVVGCEQSASTFTFSTPTVTSGSLSWALVGTVSNAAQGVIAIYQGTLGVSGFVGTTQCAYSAGTSCYLSVVAFDGATGVGTFNKGSGTSGAPTLSVSAGTAGSWVVTCGNDFQQGLTRTLDGNSSSIDQWVDSGGGNTYWVERTTTATVAPGSVSVGTSSPTSNNWNMAGLEIVGTISATLLESAAAADGVAVYGPITILPQTDFQSAFQPAAFQEYGFGSAEPATYAVNDSATAQDALGEAQAFTASLSDGATPGEASAVRQAATASLSDAATPGDATALAQRFALSLADGATPGEATAIRAAYAQTLADACQALDDFATATAQGGTGDSAAVADGAISGDAIALKAAAAAVLADSCAPGEAFAVAMAYAIAFEDGCAARDRAAQSTGAVGPVTPTHAGGTLRLGGTLRAKGTLRGKL